MNIEELIKINENCDCGKKHINPIDKILAGSGVINKLPDVIAEYKKTKAFVLSDKNTYKAAGEKVCEILKENNIDYKNFTINEDMPEPDEISVGSVIMHYDSTCDIIIGVGSGVINDISKTLSNVSKNPYIIVATAPSMDGYASATSSMSMDGLKVSLNSKCANVIIGDTDILKNAPLHLLKAGLGDMIAKYVSICEWKIAHLILGEYYCDTIANLVKKALKKCVDNAQGLLKRDEEAVLSVFEGLTICGVAMAYAGVSRPASGVEHYFSHVWDMRGIEFGTKVDLHGIQCALGTLISIRLYEKIKTVVPDRNKALEYAQKFDFADWANELKDFLGKAAQSMIALEEREQKYNVDKHAKRLEIILNNWQEILNIISEELPSSEDIEKLLDKIGAPKTTDEIGIPSDILTKSFKSTKDIRDKYVLSRLAWDLGIIDEMM